MFGTIRKHQTWLWAVIIGITVVTFVIFFSPATKVDMGGQEVNLGSINGERITQDQFRDAMREVTLHFFFMSGGEWPDSEAAKQRGFDVDRETYQWLLLIQKVNQYRIHISPEMVAQVARDMVGHFQRAGVASPQAFIQDVLEPRGLQATDFERFVRHYLGIQELMSTVALGGKLVTPQEAEELYTRQYQDVATEAVFFDASNYLAQVSVTPQGLSQFYSNRLADYRIPKRVQVRYVAFPITNSMAQAESELAKTNLSERVEAAFNQLGTNYTVFGKTPEAAKAKIREELIRREALMEERRKANQFATDLFAEEPVRPENLETLAKARGLSVKETAPFDINEGPKDLEVGADFATAAFALTPTNDPFSQPLIGQDAIYVLGYDRQIPSEIPSLASIRDKVIADYKHSQAVNLARAAGVTAHTGLTNALTHVTNFTAAAAMVRLKAVELPPFSIATRSIPDLNGQVQLEQLKEMAFSTAPGKVSSFEPTRDGGVILYVKSKLPVDQAKMKEDMPAFIHRIRQSRQNEAFNEWFRRVASTGLRDTPLNQPKPATMGSRPGKS